MVKKVKIVLAPDSFKGTFSAEEVCRAFERGVRQALPGADTLRLPLADGGEGTLDAVLAACGGERISCGTRDPLGRDIEASYGMLATGEALIEMAASSGLALLSPDERDPWRVDTFGLGLLVDDALGRGADPLTLTLGGSATVDGGTGMARALGYRFLDSRGAEITEAGGRVLERIDRIDSGAADRRIGERSFRALCDVNNPLTGPRGAAHVFAPQKGAGPEMVVRLERGMVNLARCLESDLGRRVEHMTGAGAAGGLGAAVSAFLGGELVAGSAYILDLLGFDRALEGASLVITGEGSYDSQSLGGKVISAVVERARARGVPVAVVCGASDGVGSSGGPAVFSASSLDTPVEGLLGAEELSRLAGMATREMSS